MFEALAARAQAVGELADTLPVSWPALSQRLRVLREAGLVTDRAVGTRRIHEVHPTGLTELRNYLDGFWETSMRAFKQAAEQSQREAEQR